MPIFAMTANAFTDDIEESRKAGMNEHLSKPLDGAELMRVIKRYSCPHMIDRRPYGVYKRLQRKNG